MKAVRFYAAGDVRVEEIDIPKISSAEILVKIDACAVCGSDMKAAVSGNPRIKPPMTMGHEFTGVICEIGKDVKGYQIGERIVMATSISCGECYYCKRGWRNLCSDLAPMGFSYNGGMAEYTVIPERAIKNGHLVKVPAGVPAEVAALAEPVSCAVNSLSNCNISEGDTVLVIGAGPMGILNALIAKASKASKVMIAELNDERLKQCEGFGFYRLINPVKENLNDIVMSETDGYGADIVIVAAPAAAPQEEALRLTRKRGTVCLFASLPVGKSMLNIDSREIHYKELRVVGCSDSTSEHVQKAVEFLSSEDFPGSKIVTHTLPLEQIDKAFELMRSGQSLRVVLKTD